MTTLNTHVISDTFFDGKKFKSMNSAFTMLAQAIQEYLASKYEAFLINSVEELHYAGETLGYQVQVERGNLIVEMIFDQEGQLLNAQFDY